MVVEFVLFMEELLRLALDTVVYFAAGLVAAYFYYIHRRRDMLGGFWGAAVIGTIGAVLVVKLATIFDHWFYRLIVFLMQPKWDDTTIFRVNLIAAAAGAFIFLYILNRINHDKERP